MDAVSTPKDPNGRLARSRALIRRRPITCFLVMAYVGLWAALTPVLLLEAPYRPFTALGAVVGLAIPALIVTWACDGRDGVNDLLSRSTRWRVRPWWHFVALLWIPFTAWVTLWLIPSATPTHLFGEHALQLLVAFTVEVLVALFTVQLFEELAWTGLMQQRLQERHGALRASLMIAPAFAMIHLPTYFVGAPVTAQKAVAVLFQMTVIIIFAAFFRVLIAWVYNVAAQSVLVAATLHASFNTASGADFIDRLSAAGVEESTASMLSLAAVVAIACLVVVGTKGRLGLANPQEAQRPEIRPSRSRDEPATPTFPPRLSTRRTRPLA